MIIAFLAAAITGFEKLLYKGFVHPKNFFDFTILWLFICSFIFLIVSLFNFSFPQDPTEWKWALLAGFFWTIASISNFKAYSLIDVSVKVLISRFKLVVVLFLSWIWLGEALTINKILGSGMIILGIVVASYDPKKLRGEWSGIWMAVLAACFYGMALTTDKRASVEFDPALYTSLMFGMPFIALSVVRILNRRKLSFLKVNRADISGALLTAALASVGYFLLIQSYRTLDAGTAVAILESGTVISLLGGIIFFKERRRLVQRLIACGIIISGVITLV